MCFPWLHPYAPNKLENRSLPCVFLGYSLTQSGYQCLDPVSGRVYISRHVRFNETVFPYRTLITPAPLPKPQDLVVPPEPYTIIQVPSLIQSSPSAVNNQAPASDTSPASQRSSPGVTSPAVSSPAATSPAATSPAVTSPTATSPVATSPAASPTPPATSTDVAPAVQPPVHHSMTTRSRNNITKPSSNYNLHVEVQSDPHWIPTTWQHAIKHERWRKAMGAEFNSTNENHTWDLVEATRQMNIVRCRWVFTIKYNPDGSIDRYKARIVAKGFHQQPGVDYNDTFSPVIKFTTIRLILGLAVNSDWLVRQIDVKTAFLQGHLDEEVFMCQPPGFHDADRPTHVF